MQHDLTRRLISFRDERDWKQFHGLKNLLASLNLEAAELLETTQWLTDAQADARLKDGEFIAKLEEECADVFLYLLLICEKAGIDLEAAAHAKIDKNGEKYPVEKAKGLAAKYSEL